MPFHPHQPSRARRPRPEPTHTRPDTDTQAADAIAPVLYTPGEAAQLLKVRESDVERLIQRGASSEEESK